MKTAGSLMTVLTPALCVLLLAGCSSFHDQSATENETASADSLAYTQSGPEVTIEGTARNAKAGAVVVTDKAEVYYLDKKTTWAEGVEEGRRVAVQGELVETEWMESEIPHSDSVAAKGMIGKQKLIRNPRFEFMQSLPVE